LGLEVPQIAQPNLSKEKGKKKRSGSGGGGSGDGGTHRSKRQKKQKEGEDSADESGSDDSGAEEELQTVTITLPLSPLVQLESYPELEGYRLKSLPSSSNSRPANPAITDAEHQPSNANSGVTNTQRYTEPAEPEPPNRSYDARKPNYAVGTLT
jgi:hypothetical protein